VRRESSKCGECGLSGSVLGPVSGAVLFSFGRRGSLFSRSDRVVVYPPGDGRCSRRISKAVFFFRVRRESGSTVPLEGVFEFCSVLFWWVGGPVIFHVIFIILGGNENGVAGLSSLDRTDAYRATLGGGRCSRMFPKRSYFFRGQREPGSNVPFEGVFEFLSFFIGWRPGYFFTLYSSF
jgi:hypothetical protein